MENGTLRSAKEGLCATCYAKATEKCSKCKQRYYCSTACQVKDWHLGHKGDCGLADLEMTPVPRPPVRLLPESVERPVHSDAGWRRILESSDFAPKSGWPRGLRNVANCCYMNALLQSLYHSVPLLHGALKQRLERELERRNGDDDVEELLPCFRRDLALLSEKHLVKDEARESDDDWRLEDVVELYGLKAGDLNGKTAMVTEILPFIEGQEARLGVMIPGRSSPLSIKTQNMRFLYNRGEVPLPPYEVLRWLPRLNEEFTFGAQEDAHEFFNSLLRLLEDEELKEHAERLQESSQAALEPNADLTALPSRIFGGLLVSRCTCTRRECAASSFSFEPFRDLSLEITEATQSLEDMLKLFTAPERLDKQNSWKCETCSEVVRARKQMTIYSPPSFLVLHLKRFRFMERGKVTKIVPFPPVLNLRPYLSSGAQDEGRPVNYDLRAVIVHVDKAGYSHFGHYIAFVKCAEPERKGAFKWYLIDDSIVQEVEEYQVLQQQAYLLFYIRITTGTETVAPSVSSKRGAKGTEEPALPSRCKGLNGTVCSFFASYDGLCTRCYQELHGRPPPAADANAAASPAPAKSVGSATGSTPTSNGYATPKPAAGKAGKSSATNSAPAKTKKVGPNDQCPCGSGKKYKKCHGGA